MNYAWVFDDIVKEPIWHMPKVVGIGAVLTFGANVGNAFGGANGPLRPGCSKLGE